MFLLRKGTEMVLSSYFIQVSLFIYRLNCSVGAAGRTVRRTFEFGRTHVVRPKGKHQATIVWLHGLGDNGSR